MLRELESDETRKQYFGPLCTKREVMQDWLRGW